MNKKFVSLLVIIVAVFSFQTAIFAEEIDTTGIEVTAGEQQQEAISAQIETETQPQVKQLQDVSLELPSGFIITSIDFSADTVAICGYKDRMATNLKLDAKYYDIYPIFVVGSNAFMGYESLESVTIPEGFKEIRDGAFENCEKLKDVYLPESVEYISPNAFLGSTNVVINAPLHSYAEKFAEENGLQFVNTSPAEKFSVTVDEKALMSSFKVMGLGMAGIFIVIVVIYLSLVVMNGVFKPKA
jgi:hypothetical protein